MDFLGWLVVGIALGGVPAWMIARSRSDAATADGARLIAEAQAAAAEANAGEAAAQAELADAQERIQVATAEARHAQQRADEVLAGRDELLVQFKALSAETVERQGRAIDSAADQRLKATAQLMAPVQENLRLLEQRLVDVEKERVAIATDLRSQVEAVRNTGESLRSQTAALVTALRKPQVRGAWGELQLRRVVELAGMVEHCDFAEQQTTTNSSGATIRPDLKVMLSADRFLYVDAKVPLSAFLDAHEAPDASERARLLGAFARNVTTHIDQLSAKGYHKVDGLTPEFVVLFLGSEALAAEAFNQLPSLHEYATARNVVLATPSSLIALLKTVAYSWRQVALAESVQQVYGLGRELHDRLSSLGRHVDKVGRSLTAAVDAYNHAVGSLEGRVLPTARKLRELKIVESDLPVLHGSEAAVRPLSAPELVADAVQVPSVLGRRAGGAASDGQWSSDGAAEGERSDPPAEHGSVRAS